MDWIGPAVIAAGVSGIISIVGLIVNRATTLSLHGEKLEADRALTDRKVQADIDLARAKFDYDRQQAIFRRRFELAEQLLADTYRFNDLMTYVRNGVAFEGGGLSRKSSEGEHDNFERMRNAYFVPVERLQKESEFISAMMARRHASRAHFGDDADKAYSAFYTALNRVQIASSLLVGASELQLNDREYTKDLLCDIWQGRAKVAKNDSVGDEIKKGVDLIEKLCRPTLEMKEWE